MWAFFHFPRCPDRPHPPPPPANPTLGEKEAIIPDFPDKLTLPFLPSLSLLSPPLPLRTTPSSSPSDNLFFALRRLRRTPFDFFESFSLQQLWEIGRTVRYGTGSPGFNKAAHDRQKASGWYTLSYSLHFPPNFIITIFATLNFTGSDYDCAIQPPRQSLCSVK